MFGSVRSYLAAELDLFQKLNWQVQRFLLVIVLYETIKPVFSFFTNTYLWRQSPQFEPIILYNLAIFISVVLGFYFNNLLLKKVELAHLFTISMISLVVTTFFLFITPVTSATSFVLGLLFGLPMGMYWSNRHLIKQMVTTDANRNYISSLEIFLAAPSILTPLLIGWIIAGGELTGWYTATQAYWFVLLLTAALLAWASYLFRLVHIRPTTLHQVAVFRVSPEWQLMRVGKIFEGLQGGVTIVMPTIMILYALGNENTVGTIMTVAVLLATACVYQLGKMMLPHHRGAVTILSAALLAVASLAMAIQLNPLIILLNIFTIQVAGKFIIASFSPIVMECVDLQDNGDPTNNATYLADAELFVNAGRVVALLLILWVLPHGQELTLRFSAVLSALAFVGLMIVVRNMTQTKIRHAFSQACLITLRRLRSVSVR